MNHQELVLKAKKIFENHLVDVLFVTTDGLVFFEKQFAENHAIDTLKNDQVFEVTREEAGEAETEVVTGEAETKETTDTKPKNPKKGK